MKRWRVIAPIAATSLFAVGFYIGWNDSLYFKINKSLEIFGSLFREVSEKYVDELDPEEFVRGGINKMLAELDPYTVFMGDGEADDIDALTSGSYTGFGITAGIRDSMMTITGIYDGYSAQQNGVRIGDRILRIDSSFTLYAGSGGLRKYSRGEAGSKAHITLLRGENDTLTMILTRQVIRITNVSYSGILPNDVGYIKLERFSRRASEEVRSALGELQVGRQLKGLVLDLRDNPGGLLESAVEVCEIFVPTGSRIVTTRGRDTTNRKIYISKITPSEPALPLVVLINGASASASEVVAGAIQDLDRGVIVGERSFGKGLVQNVFPLPHNTSLKITTAKYYTPSGRCIQAIDFAKRRVGLRDQTDSGRVFYTKAGRAVQESHGIAPDSTANTEVQSYFLRQLIENNVIFRFANDYAAPFATFPEMMQNGSIVKEFSKWLDEHGNFKSNSLESLAVARKAAENEKVPYSVMAKFDALEKSLRKDRKALIKRYEQQLRRTLEAETVRRLATNRNAVDFSLKRDSVALKAADIAASSAYRKILSATESDVAN
ncbi:S41 family peptidase [Ignavibacteria bacterium]|nr:S41 family peptidase [Bacteroidota bacterium]MCZ2132563.1 S41 family peptidase [Bacteroidota bacterium]